ncbi:MAG: hypothetical protein R3B06_11425 [Kofleriaceae bacterium]
MVATTHECDVCHAKVHELRRGRCWGCYARWADARPVGAGARCVLCLERRRRVLRSVELVGAWHPVCFSCHGQVQALEPVPPTIAEIRAALTRERRTGDRRFGKADSRVFQYERRVGQRRELRDGEWVTIDDDMLVEMTVEGGEPAPAPVFAMPPGATDSDFEDLTRILERVAG